MIDFATFQAKIAEFEISAGWAKEFTNGSDTYTFNTDSGAKISFAKAIKDFQDSGDTTLASKVAEFTTSLASKEGAWDIALGAKQTAWDSSLSSKEADWDNSSILATVLGYRDGAQAAQAGSEAARDEAEAFKNTTEAAKAVVLGSSTVSHVLLTENQFAESDGRASYPSGVVSLMRVTSASWPSVPGGVGFVITDRRFQLADISSGVQTLFGWSSDYWIERKTYNHIETWYDWYRPLRQNQAGLASLSSANFSGNVDISGSLTIGNQDLTNPESVPNIAQTDARYGAEYVFTALPLPAADANGLIILDTDILLANLPFDPFWATYARGSMTIQIDLQYLLEGQSFNNRIIYNLTTKLIDGYMRVDEQQHVTASEVHVAVGFTVDFQNNPTTNALQLHIQLLSTDTSHWTGLYLKGVVKP